MKPDRQAHQGYLHQVHGSPLSPFEGARDGEGRAVQRLLRRLPVETSKSEEK